MKPLGNIQEKGDSALKIFDYMSCGLALVLQADGDKGDIIRKWETGIITTGSPQDLADKISVLEKNRELCSTFGKNGRRAVIDYYNWDRVARETDKVLLSMI